MDLLKAWETLAQQVNLRITYVLAELLSPLAGRSMGGWVGGGEVTTGEATLISTEAGWSGCCLKEQTTRDLVDGSPRPPGGPRATVVPGLQP